MSQDGEQPTPDGVLAYILNELIELKVSQVTLDAMVGVGGHHQRWCCLGYGAADPMPSHTRSAYTSTPFRQARSIAMATN